MCNLKNGETQTFIELQLPVEIYHPSDYSYVKIHPIKDADELKITESCLSHILSRYEKKVYSRISENVELEQQSTLSIIFENTSYIVHISVL